MEQQFSRTESGKYWSNFVRSFWSGSAILLALPFILVALIRSYNHVSTDLEPRMMIGAVAFLCAMLVTSGLMSRIIGRRMSKKDRWYLTYLRHQQNAYERRLDFIRSNARIFKDYGQRAKILAEMKSGTESEQSRLIASHEATLRDLENERCNTSSKTSRSTDRRINDANDAFLDELNRLLKTGVGTDVLKRRAEWKAIAEKADQRVLDCKEEFLKTKQVVSRIIELQKHILSDG